MKEYDIFMGPGVKTYYDPSYIFSGVKTPNPQDIHPWMRLLDELQSNSGRLAANRSRIVVLTITKMQCTEISPSNSGTSPGYLLQSLKIRRPSADRRSEYWRRLGRIGPPPEKRRGES